MAIKTLKLPFGQIKGLMQGIDKSMLSFSYSPNCQNIDVDEGIISTRNGSVPAYPSYVFSLDYVFNGKTIKDYFVFNDGTQKYLFATAESTSPYTVRWFINPDVDAGIATPINNSTGTPATFNVPLLARAKMLSYSISGDVVRIFANGGAPFKLYLSSGAYVMALLGGSPPNAIDLALHRERVWMATANNAIYYSNAYNPEDWTTAGETGSIDMQTFDGDTIIGIVNVFDDILIFKTNSLWRINGDVPSEYAREQLFAAKGAIYKDSICTDGENCFYATTDGVYQYNGTTGIPILTSEIKDIYADVLYGASNIQCDIADYKLYISSNGTKNKIIVYDIRKKTLSVIYLPYKKLKSFDHTIYYWSASDVLSKLNSTSLKFDDGLATTGVPPDDLSSNIAAYWYTPESTLDYPNAEKTLTDLYFTGWGTTSAGAAGGQVKITVYYNKNGTEKTKEKTITLQTTRKPHAVRYNLTGRIFKFKFENVSGSAVHIADIVPVFELSED